MDIRVKLNNNTYINLEMQVANQHNWTDRSLLYLCRTYDHLEKGDDYTKLLPAIHIGFLDFPEHPEFYATYKLLNTKNYHLYSDKFILRVLDLTCINLATEEDKAYGIDHWARIFKATTWEELRMLAQDNEYMNEAVQTLHECNADKIIREQCRARETRIAFENMRENYIKQLNDKVQQLDTEKEQLKAEMANKDALIAKLLAEKEHSI